MLRFTLDVKDSGKAEGMQMIITKRLNDENGTLLMWTIYM